MATQVLNPRGWYRLYRDTEIAALKHLADWLVRAGFTISMGLEAKQFWMIGELQRVGRESIRIRATIRPYRDGSGLWVTVYAKELPSTLSFDGQDYRFMHDEADGIVALSEWLEESRYANS